jgi:hypothetical protein
VRILKGAGAPKWQVLHCEVPADEKVFKTLAIPVWMFDRSVCEPMELRAVPQVSWSALADLKRLIRDSVPSLNEEGYHNEARLLRRRSETTRPFSPTSRSSKLVDTSRGDPRASEAITCPDTHRSPADTDR